MIVLDSVYSPKAAPAENRMLAMPRVCDQPGECDTAEHRGPGDRHARSLCLSSLHQKFSSLLHFFKTFIPIVKMDCDSKHGEEDCQLKENRVHQYAGGLIVQNPNQSLKCEQMRIREESSDPQILSMQSLMKNSYAGRW